jgi:hypothetical protein
MAEDALSDFPRMALDPELPGGFTAPLREVEQASKALLMPLSLQLHAMAYAIVLSEATPGAVNSQVESCWRLVTQRSAAGPSPNVCSVKASNRSSIAADSGCGFEREGVKWDDERLERRSTMKSG